jgi:hypothetical protein
MEVLQEEGARGGCLAADQQDLLLRLVEQRRQAELCFSSSGKRHTSLSPDFHVSISSTTSPKLRHHTMAADGISHSSPNDTPSFAAPSPSLRDDGDETVVNISFLLPVDMFMAGRQFVTFVYSAPVNQKLLFVPCKISQVAVHLFLGDLSG